MPESWFDHAHRGLGASTRHNALAYGYSLALTGTFGVLVDTSGTPQPYEILLFAIGAAITFTIANVVSTEGFRTRVKEEPPAVRSLGSSLGFLSVTGSIAVAWALGWAFGRGWVPWLVAPFASSAVYLLLSALEISAARGLRAALDIELEEKGGNSEG